MIYTFGRTSAYEKHIRETEEPMKIGKTADYKGGAVWRTREEAQAFVDSMPNEFCPDWHAKDFSVYGVLADWVTGTYVGEERAPWYSLKEDAPLVKLEDE